MPNYRMFRQISTDYELIIEPGSEAEAVTISDNTPIEKWEILNTDIYEDLQTL
jgi:hypothetical protein